MNTANLFSEVRQVAELAEATPVLLDASAFPHITNNILDHLYHISPASFFAARGVCREWYNDIMPRLFSHVTISLLTATEYRVDTNPFGLCLPLQIHDEDDEGISHELVMIAPYVRVLDIKGPLPNSVLEQLAPYMTGLQTVRIREPVDNSARLLPFTQAYTLVTEPTGLISFPNPAPNPPNVPAPTLHAVNFREFDRISRNPALGVLQYWPRAPHLVLLYYAPPHEIEEMMEATRMSLMNIFANVIKTVFVQGKDVGVVVVSDASPAFGQMTLTATCQLASTLHPNRQPFTPAEVSGHIKFMTHAEYRASVGEERYQLLTLR